MSHSRIHNANYNPTRESSRRFYHDIFVPSYHKEHTYAQFANLYGEHQLLAFVVLTTPRFESKLQISLVIPHGKPHSVNIVATISNNDNPSVVEPLIIPQQPSALRDTPFERVAFIVADDIKTMVDKTMGESMDRRYKDYLGQQFRYIISQLAQTGNLRVVSTIGIENILLRANVVPVLATNTLLHMYDIVKADDVGGGGDVSLTTAHTGDTGKTTTTLTFSPKNSGRVFAITEHSDTYVTIEHHNARAGRTRSNLNRPTIVKLNLDEPSECHVDGEIKIVEHKNNLIAIELLVLLYKLYPTSKFLARICDRINY